MEAMMKKFFAVLVSMALLVSVAISTVWAGGDKVRSDNAAGPAGTDGGGDPQASRGTPVGESVQILSVQEDMKGKNGQFQGTLTQKEIDHILFIREEEKLARDVYLTLYEIYQAPIFDNISESEQRHMDAVKRLIDKYGLEDPVEDDAVGIFTNPVFTKLYEDLVDKGETGYCVSLQVGIDIEVLDIEDIEIALLNDVEAQDVNRVFNNLLSGSYNHLNAFNSQYTAAECPIEE
jgi:hypothetical protein